MTAHLPAQLYACGFSWRKRAIVRRFVAPSRVRFVRGARAVPAGASLLLWGGGPAPAGLAPGVSLFRLEDGFLRSVGLGAELATPLSWVVDRRGIHYDPGRPSDLEVLLQTGEFGAALLARAAALRHRIVAHGLTKYNVGTGAWQRPDGVGRVILVPGQVESDASLRFGAPGLATNLGLVQAVRQAHPEAYLVYKPHPDVVAGLRARGRGERDAGRYCDAVVEAVAMGGLLDQVDEVHVLTSLAGFEALLRGKTVVCHGQPFYAGWGLTTDRLPPPRRGRQLPLDALVAAALILYPRYVGRAGQVVAPEQVLDELLAWRGRVAGPLPLWRAALRLALGARQGAR